MPYDMQDTLASTIDHVIAGAVHCRCLPTDVLAETISKLNEAYRRGQPLVSDARYDAEFIAELRQRAPEHPFLSKPEPEPEDAFNGARYAHSVPMLSTDKAYGTKDVAAFVARAIAAAEDAGIDYRNATVSVTPKLDGIAGMRYADALVTRGRNGFGTDISHLLKLDVVETLPGHVGPGELVVDQAYFDSNLARQYEVEHPRNYVAGLASAQELQRHHLDALRDRAVRFVAYASLTPLCMPLSELVDRFEEALAVTAGVPYLCDGAVVAIDDPALRQALGHTSHHHRWMLALKRNDEAVETTVTGISMFCGRSGRITPTLQLEPISLYGVTITNATAHTAQHIKDLGLGAGARVLITRGGGVIPKLERVVAPVENSGVDFDHCPACGGATEWQGKYLVCTEPSICRAQAARALEHYFGLLGTCHGFGPAVCEQLVASGHVAIDKIYRMDTEAFVAAGISPGIAANLVAELARSRREPIPDATFLGAFGIRHLGRGDSRRILQHHPIETVHQLDEAAIRMIDGFGPGTSRPIAMSLAAAGPTLESLLALGFNLVRTPRLVEQAAIESPIAGKTLVFTGSMTEKREDMESHARALGATVGGSVTRKTDYLVCGENVGATKTDKALTLGVKVITEAAYRALIASH